MQSSCNLIEILLARVLLNLRSPRCNDKAGHPAHHVGPTEAAIWYSFVQNNVQCAIRVGLSFSGCWRRSRHLSCTFRQRQTAARGCACAPDCHTQRSPTMLPDRLLHHQPRLSLRQSISASANWARGVDQHMVSLLGSVATQARPIFKNARCRISDGSYSKARMSPHQLKVRPCSLCTARQCTSPCLHLKPGTSLLGGTIREGEGSEHGHSMQSPDPGINLYKHGGVANLVLQQKRTEVMTIIGAARSHHGEGPRHLSRAGNRLYRVQSDAEQSEHQAHSDTPFTNLECSLRHQRETKASSRFSAAIFFGLHLQAHQLLGSARHFVSFAENPELENVIEALFLALLLAEA